jgi:hypothetical protein
MDEGVGDEEMGDDERFFVVPGSCILTCFDAVLGIAKY